MARPHQLLSLSLIFCALGFATAVSAAPAPPSSATANPKLAASPVVAPVLKEVTIELELIRVLALSQADGRAVLAFPDGIMVTAQTGDAIARTRAILKQVLPEKLILEQATGAGAGKQVVWMHKAQGAKPGKVERFSSLTVAAPVAPPPINRSIVLPEPGASASAAPARKP